MKIFPPIWLLLLTMACEQTRNSQVASTNCQFTSCPNSDTTPFDSRSPWPKFRGNMQQNGRSAWVPLITDAEPWSFASGKGVFSSPIIAADQTILFGSADHNFYALNADGSLRWKVPTGEIVDSSGLVDRHGKVYFGSGDGYLRAVELASGNLIWDFLAEDPVQTKAYIRWFEGNVAVGKDGTLYAPNDNFRLYALDADKGESTWTFPLNDQSWSSPAVDPDSGHLFFGSNYIAPFAVVGSFYKNIFALNPAGKILWRQGVQASVAASPLLSLHNFIVVGSFDGSVRAYRKNDGQEVWNFRTGDHLYSSPAELSNGWIIQASTDGRVYALDGTNGQLQWTFDAREPIRSSPAVDGADHIYFGGGDGALYVLEKNGQLRFRLQLIEADRNDLNASPALGREAVYIAGEDGVLWSVPYDYCLGSRGQADVRCSRHTNPQASIDLQAISAFGSYRQSADITIGPSEVLALRLTQDLKSLDEEAILDPASIQILGLDHLVTVQVGGDQKTLYVLPKDRWGLPGSTLAMTLKVVYKKGFQRKGLKREGGTVAGQLQKTWNVHIQSGDLLKGQAFALSRLAVPVPSIMPSYNQIGFDSLSYVVRIISGNDQQGLAYMLPAGVDKQGNISELAGKPFALNFERTEGSLRFWNNGGFEAQALNFTIPFEDFRIEADASEVARLFARTGCARIPTYGYFLRALGFCSSQDDQLSVFGAAAWRVLDRPFQDQNALQDAQLKKDWLGRPKLRLILDALAMDPQRPLSIILQNARQGTRMKTFIEYARLDGDGATAQLDLLLKDWPSGADSISGVDWTVHILQGPRKIGQWQIPGSRSSTSL